MKKINENSKVTLTLGQLKRLVKESVLQEKRESVIQKYGLELSHYNDGTEAIWCGGDCVVTTDRKHEGKYIVDWAGVAAVMMKELKEMFKDDPLEVQANDIRWSGRGSRSLPRNVVFRRSELDRTIKDTAKRIADALEKHFGRAPVDFDYTAGYGHSYSSTSADMLDGSKINYGMYNSGGVTVRDADSAEEALEQVLAEHPVHIAPGEWDD